MNKYLPFLVFLCFLLPQQASAAVYFIDYSTGSDANNGLSTTSPFLTLNQFTNNARAAGDIAFIRRGTATTTGVLAATFTSDGVTDNPISIQSDFDNLWSAFATSSQTFSPTFGQTYIATSASTTDAFPTKWIYFMTDCYERYNPVASSTNPCEFAYEIATASSTGISLYLPYKGNQAGTGKEGRLMPYNTQIGTVTEAAQIFTMSQDNFWVIRGLDVRSTNSSCTVSVSATFGTSFRDMIVQGDGVTDCGIRSADPFSTYFKTRIFGQLAGFSSAAAASGLLLAKDILINCNSVASSAGFLLNSFLSTGSVDSFSIINCTNDIAGSGPSSQSYSFSNTGSRKQVYNTISGNAYHFNTFQDDFATVGLNSTMQNTSAPTLATTTISDTANLRAGGGPLNRRINPPATGGGSAGGGVSTLNFPTSYIKLFEYPIYANTSSKTYSIFFMSTSTGQWTTDPITATLVGSSTPELFIECEYYNDTLDADRILKRSNTAAAIDFNGSTAWQSLSVTCQPTQSGILYLRGWYAKPQEGAGKPNYFFLDTTPVVS